MGEGGCLRKWPYASLRMAAESPRWTAGPLAFASFPIPNSAGTRELTRWSRIPPVKKWRIGIIQFVIRFVSSIKNICPAGPGWIPWEERLTTKAEVASFFQVNVRTVERWMTKGYLPYRKLGNQVRFRMGDLLAQLDQDDRPGAPKGSGR